MQSFPLSFIDSILDAVVGHECYSFLDGFSRYNQVQIAEEVQLKTTFTMDWETLVYTIMLFGLCNALATFQGINDTNIPRLSTFVYGVFTTREVTI